MNLLDMNALWLASAAFAILLVILAVLGVVSIVVSRYHPTLAQASAAEKTLLVRRQELADIEEKIRIEQARYAEAGKKASEVAWLEERKSNLKSKIETLAPRRAEIVEVQQELDRVASEFGDTVREATAAKSELESLRAEIERGQRLKTEIEAMERRQGELEDELKRLQTERDDAVHAKRQLSELKERLDQITETVTKKEGILASLEQKENNARERVVEATEEAAEAEQRYKDTSEVLVEARQERASLKREVDELQERRTELQVKINEFKRRIGEMEGEVEGGPKADPLDDLKKMPLMLKPLLRPSYNPRSFDDGTESAYLRRAKQAIEESGLRYHDRTVRAFHTALKIAQEAPMTVLSGISGTGKTQLPRRYAEGMGMGFLLMPVQPRWDSPQDMLGFYNFIERKYKATELARAMWQLNKKGEPSDAAVLSDRMLLVLLDEMNLARVEYYFSEFLSRLEVRPPPKEVEDPDKRHLAEILIEVPNMAPVGLFLEHSLLFTGTMNEDETTQSLSDKVLDRGNMLRFPAPKELYESDATTTGATEIAPIGRQVWSAWRHEISNLPNLDEARNMVTELAELMGRLERPFGHRVGQAMLAYAANYPAHDGQHGSNLHDAMSDQVEMRLLPKLRGLDLEMAQDSLGRLADHVKDTLRDEKLAEAIEASIAASADTGRFAWTGLTR